MEPIEEFIRKNKAAFEFLDFEQEDLQCPTINSRADKSISIRKNNRSRWYAMAAAITLFLIGSSTLFYFSKETKDTLATGLEEQKYFPDLALENPEGETISIANLKGKIVLVEFWASYCMMCTHEQCYYFKPLYNTFKDQGFEIYSVSVDSIEHHWVQSIEKEELNWIQVSDLMGQHSPVIDQFDVTQLPTNYLLDRKGKIIARNIEAEKLEETLSLLLAYK